MYQFLKSLLFKKDPEDVHYWTMRQFHRLLNLPFVRYGLSKRYRICEHPSLKTRVLGLSFKNPVGMAAGFDKDARFIDDLAPLGFGFIEIGTLTPLAQPGNDRPRLFRLPEDQALINRMGFNNQGVAAAVQRLKKRKTSLIIGGNIGKNKVTPNEEAVDDYEKAFKALYDYVDYFTVNVSSPNTPGLRALQEKEPLKRILTRLQKLNRELHQPKPILLKIAPDLTNEQLGEVVDLVLEIKLDGMIATNTTISRADLKSPKNEVTAIGNGGLSGLPVQNRSTEVVRYIHHRSQGQFPIIASGGIFTAQDAKDKLEAGASLVQVFTGFIYEGPDIVRSICQGLVDAERS